MTTTPNLGIELMATNTLQKEMVFNEGMIAYDALFGGVVISGSLTAPPSSPAQGDLYVVGLNATGAWSGKSNQLAFFYNGWRYLTPPARFRIFNLETGTYFLRGIDGTWTAATAAETEIPPWVIYTKTDDDTLVAQHAGGTVLFNKASAINCTVPANATVAFPAGTEIEVGQTGDGQLTIVPAGGVTITGANDLKFTKNQYGRLRKIATNTWHLAKWQGAAPLEVPTGGTQGQVLMRGADNTYGWATPAEPGDQFPALGSEGQFLAIGPNNTILWVNRPNALLPTGGETGQMLRKKSDTDQDAEWVTYSGVPAGGANGKVLGYANGTPTWINPPAGGGSGGLDYPDNPQVGFVLGYTADGPAWVPMTGGGGGGGGLRTFRYWKYALTAAPGNYVAMGELYHYVDGATRAPNPSAVTDEGNYGGGYTGSMAFDGNASTMFFSNNSANEAKTLTVDYGLPIPLDGMRFTVPSSEGNTKPVTVLVRASLDGLTYEDIDTLTLSWTPSAPFSADAEITSGAASGGVSLPAGGTTGQFLAKASDDDGDAEWVDPPESSGVPPGGSSGQVLVKNSSADGDAGWATISGGGTAQRTYSKYRITLTKSPAENNEFLISELVFTDRDGAPVTPSSITVFQGVSSDPTNNPTSKMFDGNYVGSTSFWWGNGVDKVLILDVVFATATTMSLIEISQAYSQDYKQPAFGSVSGSNDNIEFTPLLENASLVWVAVPGEGNVATMAANSGDVPQEPVYPPGGLVGQALVKQGAGDGVAGWGEPAATRKYRFYKLDMNGSLHGSVISISEIEHYEATGAPRSIPVAYEASSNNAGEGSVANLFDGSGSTKWHSGSGTAQYVTYDFGQDNAKAVSRIEIKPRANYREQGPSTVNVYGSDDGIAFTRLTPQTVALDFNLSGGNASANRVVPVASPVVPLAEMVTRLVPTGGQVDDPLLKTVGGAAFLNRPIKAKRLYRRLKINITKAGQAPNFDSPNVAIGELFVYDSDGTRLIPTASDQSTAYSIPSYAAVQTYDGNVGTIWHSGNDVATGSWVSYDFGEPVDLDRVRFVIGDGRAYMRPRSITVQVGNDNTTWTTVATQAALEFSTNADNGYADVSLVIPKTTGMLVPPGGTSGQILSKGSAGPAWIDAPSGGGGSGPGSSFTHWRLSLTKTTSDQRYVILNGIEFALSEGGAAIPAPATVTSNGFYGGNAPANVFDGNDATYFESSNRGNLALDPARIVAEFVDPVAIAEVRLKVGNNEPNERLVAGYLEASNNGSSWTYITSFGDFIYPDSNLATWTVPVEVEYITEAPKDGGSYVRKNGAWVSAAFGGYAHTFASAAVTEGNQSIGNSFTTVNLTDADDPNALFASNLYTVPEDGVYQITGSFRVSDNTPDQTQYGVGVHTSNGDGPWFLWHSTSGALRSTYPYVRIMRCTAGQQLRMFAYGSVTVSAAEMTVIRIA